MYVLDLWPYIFAADSMSLFITFRAIIFESRNLWVWSAGTKTEFDMKCPLKVILGHSFCNQLPDGKQRWSPYNNSGLNSKVS